MIGRRVPYDRSSRKRIVPLREDSLFSIFTALGVVGVVVAQFSKRHVHTGFFLACPSTVDISWLKFFWISVTTVRVVAVARSTPQVLVLVPEIPNALCCKQAFPLYDIYYQ